MLQQKEFLSQLKNVVLSHDDKAQVILYGSRARGDYKKDSDWDILVLTEKETNYIFQRKIRDEITYIELKYTIPLSTIIMNRDKWEELEITSLYKNVTAEGRKL